MHSIGIYSNNSTEASALDISDISVIDGSGKNITIIENFSEDYNDSWSTIKPTLNSLGDTISINFSSKKNLNEFMTMNPLVVNENMPATKALAIMNEKKITSLLIVSDKDYKKANKVLKGIIHIHFLLQKGI